MNVVDTSGWIEYFTNGQNASRFAPAIEDVDALVVPAICLYEVFKKVSFSVNEARAIEAVAQMKLGRVVDVTENVALGAARISLRYKLPMADSMIYATALAENAIVWTQDEHFNGLPGVTYVRARA